MPNVKWALLYGTILCTARVFGEFGAVSVVSGHIDSNDTMPLRIEKLWNEYNNQAAFCRANADEKGIPVRVEHIGFAGAIVNIELQRLDDQVRVVDDQLTLPAYKALALRRGDNAFIKLRTTHEFDIDYTI